MTLFVKIIIISIFVIGYVFALDPTVTISQGRLRGRRLQSHSGRNIHAYLGIPYAKPPIGELRFKDPEPPKEWTGIRDAKIHGNNCIQQDILFQAGTPVTGDEDCLYLNVYTNQLHTIKPEDRVPVMVYIHGGGYLSGSGSIYGPQYLLDFDLVLVTINYRLGVLGFLSTQDEHSPGNYGMKDQVAALHWVRNNIASFGGDPNKVTIFGQSAGGASVHFHMMSPLSTGLFHRAISMSGTAFASWASARDPAKQAQRLAKLVGCKSVENSEQIVACLKDKEATSLVEAISKMLEWDVDPLLLFSPTVEKPHSGKNFLPAPFTDLVKEAEKTGNDENNVPWMSGITSEDGSLRTAVILSHEELREQINADFDNIAPITLRFLETSDNPKEVAQKIRKFYFKDKMIGQMTRDNLTEMYTDRQFRVPLVQSVNMMKNFGSLRNIFLYRVSYRGNHTITSKLDTTSQTDYGVCHLDELQYLFYLPDFYPAVPVDRNNTDYLMMLLMTKMFVNFAALGYPTSDNMEFNWQTTHDNLEFADLKFPQPVMMSEILRTKSRKFWKSLNLNEHKVRPLILQHEEL